MESMAMPGDPADPSRRQAVEALDEIARLRDRTRRSLGMPWFPLICFGAVTMLSAPLVATAGTVTLIPVWLAGGAAGMLLTRRYYRRRGQRLGVTGMGWRLGAAAAVMIVLGLFAGIAGGMAGGPAAGLLAPVVMVAAGYVALGWLQHNLMPSLTIVSAAGLAAVLILHHLAPWVVELAFGAAMATAGVALRAIEARQ
jgi:hypothetical protein